MEKATESLLRELEASPTDLKKLVVSAVWRHCNAIAIESEGISRWGRHDPEHWASVQEWLLARGITITVLRSRPATEIPRAAPSLPGQPPAGAEGWRVHPCQLRSEAGSLGRRRSRTRSERREEPGLP